MALHRHVNKHHDGGKLGNPGTLVTDTKVSQRLLIISGSVSLSGIINTRLTFWFLCPFTTGISPQKTSDNWLTWPSDSSSTLEERVFGISRVEDHTDRIKHSTGRSVTLRPRWSENYKKSPRKRQRKKKGRLQTNKRFQNVRFTIHNLRIVLEAYVDFDLNSYCIWVYVDFDLNSNGYIFYHTEKRSINSRLQIRTRNSSSTNIEVVPFLISVPTNSFLKDLHNQLRKS